MLSSRLTTACGSESMSESITEKMPGATGKERTAAHGMLFLGTEPACGKTTVMTGLAAVLHDYDVPVRAIKPLGIGAHKKGSAEMSFMSIISKSAIDYPLQSLNYPPSMTESEWKELVLTGIGNKSESFSLIEIPGTPATPINFLRDEDGQLTHEWSTMADLAAAFGMPSILVASHCIDSLERIELSMTYLESKNLSVSGIVTVETNKNEGQALDDRMHFHDFELMLKNRFRTEYLGKLNFSPVVSVPKITQGNLKKCIENDLDLLEFRRHLEIAVN